MDIASARLLSVARIEPDAGWELPATTHPHHELLLVVRGCIHADIEGVKVSASTGDALFYREGWAHAEYNDRQHPFVTYGLAFVCPRIANDAPMRISDSAGRLRQLCQWLTEESDVFPATLSDAAAAFFHAILVEWHRLGTRREHALVDLTRRFIRANLHNPISLDDLAAHNGLSRFHFSRVYRQLAGGTPMDEVTRMRGDFARHLLLTTDLPLKTIAPMCGLGDQYHLCKVFKKLYRMTPGDTRHGAIKTAP